MRASGWGDSDFTELPTRVNSYLFYVPELAEAQSFLIEMCVILLCHSSNFIYNFIYSVRSSLVICSNVTYNLYNIHLIKLIINSKRRWKNM